MGRRSGAYQTTAAIPTQPSACFRVIRRFLFPPAWDLVASRRPLQNRLPAASLLLLLSPPRRVRSLPELPQLVSLLLCQPGRLCVLRPAAGFSLLRAPSWPESGVPRAGCILPSAALGKISLTPCHPPSNVSRKKKTIPLRDHAASDADGFPSFMCGLTRFL